MEKLIYVAAFSMLFVSFFYIMDILKHKYLFGERTRFRLDYRPFVAFATGIFLVFKPALSSLIILSFLYIFYLMVKMYLLTNQLSKQTN